MADKDIEALQKENAALKAQLEQRTAMDKAISQKMALGLSREQAIAVLERQKTYEKALKEKQEAEAAKAKKK